MLLLKRCRRHLLSKAVCSLAEDVEQNDNSDDEPVFLYQTPAEELENAQEHTERVRTRRTVIVVGHKLVFLSNTQGPNHYNGPDADALQEVRTQWRNKALKIFVPVSLKLPAQELTKAMDLINRCVSHILLTYTDIFPAWRARLSKPWERKKYVEYAAKGVAKGVTNGTMELLLFCDRTLPDLVRSLERLHDVRGLPWWVIYIKIAIPHPGSGLPVLWYVGSGTGTGAGATGGDARVKTHIGNAQCDSKSLDREEFHRLWRQNPDKYMVYFKELRLASSRSSG